ncbi:MAG: hypothetical protein CMF27_06855 [Kiritimatiellaceae bacterium]|nr:hypothetical protein [Kiritimatiellaceae bacterium]
MGFNYLQAIKYISMRDIALVDQPQSMRMVLLVTRFKYGHIEIVIHPLVIQNRYSQDHGIGSIFFKLMILMELNFIILF